MVMHTALLDEPQRLLLLAATGSGQPAVDAFRRWRTLVPFDDIGYSSFRLIPFLLALVKRESLDDPDLLRMKGIERHIWASNILRFKQLFLALDAIRQAGAPFVLFKGAALLARMPEIAALRTSGDYDVLIDPSHMIAVGRELKAAGFTVRGYSFDDWGDELRNSPRAGVTVYLADSKAEIDIHWRLLPDLRDPKLIERIFEQAEEGMLQQFPVPIPSPTHQLFICLARCEPWDKDECLTRLIEAYFLLSKSGDVLDWSELERLISQYRLEACASAFFEELAAVTDVIIPAAVRRRLRPWSFLLRKEWDTRRIAPQNRSDFDRLILRYSDAWYSRKDPSQWTLTWEQDLLATLNPGGVNLQTIWRSVSRRVTSQPNGRRKFLYGFSFPEEWFRWTEGRFALAVIPLNDEQKNGAPVEIRGHVLDTGRPTRIFMAGGRGHTKLELAPGEVDVTLSIPLQPLEALGGDGLLALWLPDAIAPVALGTGHEQRMLSLAIHRV